MIDEPLSAELVISRLEAAGSALLRLPHSGHSTQLRTAWPEIVREFSESYGWAAEETRLPRPDAQQISEMDEALSWLALIPTDRFVLRRIVGARCLVNSRTEKHVFSWRGIGKLIGADHKAVQRWHADGIGLILRGLEKKLAFQKIPSQTPQNMGCIST